MITHTKAQGVVRDLQHALHLAITPDARRALIAALQDFRCAEDARMAVRRWSEQHRDRYPAPGELYRLAAQIQAAGEERRKTTRNCRACRGAGWITSGPFPGKASRCQACAVVLGSFQATSKEADGESAGGD
jgi:hypothetical protein